jgi:hypothetical protein
LLWTRPCNARSSPAYLLCSSWESTKPSRATSGVLHSIPRCPSRPSMGCSARTLPFLHRVRVIGELEVDDYADLLASGIHPGQANVPRGGKKPRPYTVNTCATPCGRQGPPQLSLRPEAPPADPLREKRLNPGTTVYPIRHLGEGEGSPLGFLEDQCKRIDFLCDRTPNHAHGLTDCLYF